MHQFSSLFRKVRNIRIKETRAKPEHDHARLSLLAWDRTLNPPMIGSIANNHTDVGPIALPNMQQ